MGPRPRVAFPLRPSAWRAATGALLLLLLAPSCSSTGGTDTSTTGRDSTGVTGKRAPGAGTIIYREPLPSTGIEKKKVEPKMFVFTTAEEGLAEDVPVRTFSGTIPPGEDATAVARRLLGTPKAQTRLLSRDKFSDLWERLEATGILDLPRHRGKDPPEREDYFLFQSAEGRVIITRPAIASSPASSIQGWLRAWQDAKLLLFDFLNER